MDLKIRLKDFQGNCYRYDMPTENVCQSIISLKKTSRLSCRVMPFLPFINYTQSQWYFSYVSFILKISVRSKKRALFKGCALKGGRSIRRALNKACAFSYRFIRQCIIGIVSATKRKPQRSFDVRSYSKSGQQCQYGFNQKRHHCHSCIFDKFYLRFMVSF